MKVLTFSTHFPAGHPKASQKTCFVEKILMGLLYSEEITISRCIQSAREILDKDHPLCSYYAIRTYECNPLKHHTIRSGSRWRPGDMASLRIWSDKPYRSKQIEFAQVEIKRVWDIEISEYWWINYHILEHQQVAELAKNDGLEYSDFVEWFKIHPKKHNEVFKGQVLCWSPAIDYTHTSKV